MAINWERLHGIFYGNMNAAMYDWLAEQLGVQASALRDLEVGWVPMVDWGGIKGFGYGFFSCPQRDANGKILGLHLRSRDGDKVCYPGTKGGCIFRINPDHRKGEKGYSGGAHNWVRTMDAKELCPMCGKPDGCLLSAEKPSDPKAVICLRKQSDKKMKFGWLHIRTADGNLADASLLAGQGLVPVVEGMTDVAAAASLGLTAIGRPGNLHSQDVLGELVRGRPIVVMGENDQKSNGDWPGRDGMVATFQNTRQKTFSAKMLMPPPTIKDLRAWIVRNGLDLPTFLAYLEKNGTEKAEGVLPNNHPMTVAETFLKDHYYVNKRYLIRRWNDGWYRYDSTAGRYVAAKDPEVRADFYKWTVGKQYSVESGKGTKLEALVANTAVWGNLHQAAESHTMVSGVDMIPAWINGAKGADAKDIVVFNNGILDVPAYLEGGSEYLSPTTPDFFNTTALPIPFNPAATCPTWIKFLNDSLGNETAKIDLLQEWFGYCLTPDTSLQKLMYLRGESGSGKGTILGVLQALVGVQQHASTSLSQLAETFGLAPLIGKLVCIIGDARVSRDASAMRGLEVLLGITGNDAMQINRKFKDQLEGTVLTARITIASNDFLDVPDHSGAMLRRLNVIQFTRNFRNHPDTTLPARLAEETEGIAVWALHGLKRLREKGFTVPISSRAALAEWERDTNPLISWFQDCLESKPDAVTPKDQLFACWFAWARETKRSTWTKTVLFRRLKANYSYLSDVGQGIKGISLNQNAGRRYLGKP